MGGQNFPNILSRSTSPGPSTLAIKQSVFIYVLAPNPGQDCFCICYPPHVSNFSYILILPFSCGSPLTYNGKIYTD